MKMLEFEQRKAMCLLYLTQDTLPTLIANPRYSFYKQWGK